MSTEKSKVIDWIQQAVGSTTSKIEFEGKSLSGEGYLAQLCLVKVTLDAGEVLNLIVKIGKKDEELRKKTQVFREFCSREIYFYDKIIPAFQQFAALKNIRQPFEAFPKVYKTFLDDENEVIVMDNLKILGFELHPPQTSLNVEHTKVVLKNYAKLHASSLAMQVQDKDNFDKITENYVTPLLDFWNFHKPVVDANSVKLLEVLKEIGRDDLADKFEKKFMEKGVYSHITDVVKNTPATKAILHCDCHNNNYLFKYENEDDKSIPSDMVIIDYQASSLHSPMLDLGIFFYMTQSKTEFAQFKELMEHYHKELSSYLTEVGCDPDKVYPMSLLWSDWKKYSTYGFLIASTLFELLFIAKEEAPTMEGGDEGFMQVKLKYKDEYHDRLTGVLEHYFNFQNL